MPTHGRAAKTRQPVQPSQAARKTSLAAPSLPCLFACVFAAALTLALTLAFTRIITPAQAHEHLVTIIATVGIAIAALLAMLIWLAAASRALAGSRRNEARMLGIIRSSMEAIVTIDDAQNIVFFNPAAERIFGISAADALGTPLARFIPQRFRVAHALHVDRFGLTGASDTRMGGQRVLPGLRANGEEFPLEASISQLHEDGGKLYTVMLRDVTKRVEAENALKQSREELRQLSANLQNVREEEKHRIARELHDDLGQQLAALKMDLAALEQALIDRADEALPGADSLLDGEIPEQLDDMRRAIDAAVASLRRIAADLRPTMLDDLGLVAAIEWLANDFTNRYGIDIVRRIEPLNAAYSKQGATALFRIVQEALNNVVRHAQASAVELTLDTSGTHCLLRIADNGRGAAAHAVHPSQTKPFGLIGVRERAHRLGGSMRIDTAQDAGFAMTVTFPLQSMQQEEFDP